MRRSWQPEEVYFLRAMCAYLNNAELAEALDRTPRAVELALFRNGIHRPEEAVKANQRRRWEGESNPNWKGGVTRDPAAWRRAQKRKHHAKVLARAAVYRALKDGRLERAGCAVCGAAAQAHHDDYSKPLAVRWLCRAHHEMEHKGAIK